MRIVNIKIVKDNLNKWRVVCNLIHTPQIFDTKEKALKRVSVILELLNINKRENL